ncbi:hypothetical protein YC2023_044990 [Brassica napus]
MQFHPPTIVQYVHSANKTISPSALSQSNKQAFGVDVQAGGSTTYASYTVDGEK